MAPWELICGEPLFVIVGQLRQIGFDRKRVHTKSRILWASVLLHAARLADSSQLDGKDRSMWRIILIVEDHGAVRRGLRSLLELEFPQIHVVEASSGEEGVMRSILEPPQLVVMDISLPGMNGIEATRQIKVLYPSVPIVIFTVHEDEFYRAEARSAGASAYISKLAMKNLTAELSTFLE